MILKWTHNGVERYLKKFEQTYDGARHRHYWARLPKHSIKLDRKILQKVIDFRVEHFKHDESEYKLIMWLGS